MYKQHDDFESPKDLSSKVWRYLSLEKFLAILEYSSLYFTRADKFTDPFEGAIPRLNSDSLEAYFSELQNPEQLKKELLNLFQVNKQMTLINCWYLSEYESDAMWQIYSSRGLAIQSTFDKLRDSFETTQEDIHLGRVKYIDYEKEGMYYLNALTTFLYKRKSFSHENEIRAVYWNVNTENPKELGDTVPIEILSHGKQIKVNLETLIEKIYISPLAPQWLSELVVDILKRYKLNKNVHHSQLYKLPNERNKEEIKDSNEIKISKEVLDHFYKKDSYRINIETLEKEREKFRQYESFLNDLKEIKEEISKLIYSNKKGKFVGKESLIAFTEELNSKEKISETILKDEPICNSLYFLIGKIDTLMRNINDSLLSSKEIAILEKKVVYCYTENILIPSISLASICDKHNFTDKIYSRFKDYTEAMTGYIQANGY